MPDEVWTLLGVALGGLLAGAVAVANSVMAARQSAEDRVERREARLFEARREAFEEFMETARALLFEAVRSTDRARIPLELTDKFVASLATVHLYGVPETVEAAARASELLGNYLRDETSFEACDDAFEEFAARARRDLAGGA